LQESHFSEWMQLAFKVGGAGASHDGDSGTEAGEPIRTVLEQALAIYGELTRACGLPCFDGGKILAVSATAEPDRYRVTVSLPAVDEVPQRVFEDLLTNSLNLVLGVMRERPTSELIEALYSALEASILAPLRKHIPLKYMQDVCRIAFTDDIPFRYIGAGMTRVGWGTKSQTFYGSSIDADSAIGVAICQNKHTTASVLRLAGFPVPDHVPVRSFEAAREAARRLGWPVVVKPADRERSEGVTAGIATEGELRAAYDVATRLSGSILVESHVPGDCHRIMVAKDELIYVVKREPKLVVGDGSSTVAELVAANNAKEAESHPPWRRNVAALLDEDALRRLERSGRTPQSIPGQGEIVHLRGITSNQWGGRLTDLTETIHPENVRLAFDAARTLGLAVAGVDLMSVDVSVPWHENGAVINEMNARPNFVIRSREVHAARLMAALVEGDGRIPVHLVIGEGDLLARTRELRGNLAREGRRCHLTVSRHTEDPHGRDIVLNADTLFDRSLAMIMRRDVEELMIGGSATEFLARGFAVDRVENAFVFGSAEEVSSIVAALESRVAIAQVHRMPA
jgi:cyanophycin synthetase